MGGPEYSGAGLLRGARYDNARHYRNGAYIPESAAVLVARASQSVLGIGHGEFRRNHRLLTAALCPAEPPDKEPRDGRHGLVLSEDHRRFGACRGSMLQAGQLIASTNRLEYPPPCSAGFGDRKFSGICPYRIARQALPRAGTGHLPGKAPPREKTGILTSTVVPP